MALVPPFFLDCVVAIGFADAAGKVAYAGTGFLFGRRAGTDPADGRGTYNVFLVTNRHVLEGESTAFLRFNPEGTSPAHVFNAPLIDPNGKPFWLAHADSEVDIAIMAINVNLLEQQKIQFAFFAEDEHVLTHKNAIDAGLSEGDGVFVLGFPMGNVGAERNYVVVRQGVVARIRDSMLGAVKQFLIDATVFPGNSGGPVVTRPEMASIGGTKSISRAALIGVVCSYLPYHDVAISQQTRRPRVIFEENSGLAAVVPIDRVIEIFEAALPTPPIGASSGSAAKAEPSVTPTPAT